MRRTSLDRFSSPRCCSEYYLIIGLFKYTNFIIGSVAATARSSLRALEHYFALGDQFLYLSTDFLSVEPGKRCTRPFILFINISVRHFFPPVDCRAGLYNNQHDEIIGPSGFDPMGEGVYERLSKGFVLLFIGLFKKMILADTVAKTASFLFNDAATGDALYFCRVARSYTTAYALQIYYDFSGIGTMAIGLGSMFGLSIPLTLMHLTWRYRSGISASLAHHLSRFLPDYLYIRWGAVVRHASSNNGIDGHHAARRVMARCGMNVCYLGRPSRPGIGREPHLGKNRHFSAKTFRLGINVVFCLFGWVIFVPTTWEPPFRSFGRWSA